MNGPNRKGESIAAGGVDIPRPAAKKRTPPPPALAATLAVIGCGKMGGALVRGWVNANVLDPSRIRLYDAARPAADAVAEKTGGTVFPTATSAVHGADLLLLAVKPHLITPVLADVRIALPTSCLVLSVAAGIRLADLQAAAPPASPVIRVMPNTPSLVGAGASAFCRGLHATEEHAKSAALLFGAVGQAVEVDEKQMDAVTGLSGSGPAYFYLIIEALTDGAVRVGLPRDIARTLAAQTALGAARMVLETGEHPAVLKDAVTTPGGTTIAGLAVLEQAGVRSALIEAVRAACERAREMG